MTGEIDLICGLQFSNLVWKYKHQRHKHRARNIQEKKQEYILSGISRNYGWWSRSQTNDCGNKHLQVKTNGLQGKLCDSTATLQLPQNASFVSVFVLFCFFFKFDFDLQGQRVDLRRWGDRWEWTVM